MSAKKAIFISGKFDWAKNGADQKSIKRHKLKRNVVIFLMQKSLNEEQDVLLNYEKNVRFKPFYA